MAALMASCMAAGACGAVLLWDQKDIDTLGTHEALVIVRSGKDVSMRRAALGRLNHLAKLTLQAILDARRDADLKEQADIYRNYRYKQLEKTK